MTIITIKRCLLTALILNFGVAFGQTVKNPVVINLVPLEEEVVPGSKSALILNLKIPKGFWIGSNDRGRRTPPPTVVNQKPHAHFEYGEPEYPEPSVEGIPVHLGVTEVLKGNVKVIIPYQVKKGIELKTHTHTVILTYTPGMNAGHLNSHEDEKYTTQVIVSKGGVDQKNIPKPSMESVPDDFRVAERELKVPNSLQPIYKRLDEQSTRAKILHFLFNDPENHGKHIQTVLHPFAGTRIKRGESIGLGYGWINATREGILTSALQLRAFYNNLVGASAGMTLVSCPAAYHNYIFDAEISEGDGNKRATLRIENLTLGKNDRFGYQLRAVAMNDPRFRFFGLGAETDKRSGSVYTHEEFSGILDLFWLPWNNIRFAIGGKARTVDLKEGTNEVELPMTILKSEFRDVPGIGGNTVAGGRFSIVIDDRNQEFNPTAGIFLRITSEYNVITKNETNLDDDYGKLDINIRKYFSTVDQRVTLLLRNRWQFTSSGDVPFFEQARLGGNLSLRAFEMGRFRGQHAVFGSAEIRFLVFSTVFYGLPFEVEVAPFLDVGQVFNDNGFDGEFNLAPGGSLRLLNRPNVGIIGNLAYGQDGVVLTGGVTLPF